MKLLVVLGLLAVTFGSVVSATQIRAESRVLDAAVDKKLAQQDDSFNFGQWLQPLLNGDAGDGNKVLLGQDDQSFNFGQWLQPLLNGDAGDGNKVLVGQDDQSFNFGQWLQPLLNGDAGDGNKVLVGQDDQSFNLGQWLQPFLNGDGGNKVLLGQGDESFNLGQLLQPFLNPEDGGDGSKALARVLAQQQWVNWTESEWNQIVQPWFSANSTKALLQQLPTNASQWFNPQTYLNPSFYTAWLNPRTYGQVYQFVLNYVNRFVATLPTSLQTIVRMFLMPFESNWFGSQGKMLVEQSAGSSWARWFNPATYMNFGQWAQSPIYQMMFGWVGPFFRASGWSEQQINQATTQLMSIWGRASTGNTGVWLEMSNIIYESSANDTLLFLNTLQGMLKRVDLGQLSGRLAQMSYQMVLPWVEPFVNEMIKDTTIFTNVSANVFKSQVNTVAQSTIQAIRTTQYLANALKNMGLYNATADVQMFARLLAPLLFPVAGRAENQTFQLTGDVFEALFAPFPAFEQTVSIIAQAIEAWRIPAADSEVYQGLYAVTGRFFGQASAGALQSFIASLTSVSTTVRDDIAQTGPYTLQLLNSFMTALSRSIPPATAAVLSNPVALEQYLNSLLASTMPLINSLLSGFSSWTVEYGNMATQLINMAATQTIQAINTYQSSTFAPWSGAQVTGAMNSGFGYIMQALSPFLGQITRGYVTFAQQSGRALQLALSSSLSLTIQSIQMGSSNGFVSWFSRDSANRASQWFMSLLAPLAAPAQSFENVFAQAWEQFLQASSGGSRMMKVRVRSTQQGALESL